jgi:uncharacterized membrane protein YbhN (UPF0104 family)
MASNNNASRIFFQAYWSGKKKKKAIPHVCRVIITVLIIAFLFYYIRPREILSIFSQSKTIWLIPIIILRPLYHLIRGLKIWQILSIGTNRKLPAFKIAGWYIIACSIGVFTPGGIGDFSMGYFGRHYDISMVQSTAAVLLDKFVNIFVMGCIALIGFIIYFPQKKFAYIIMLLGIIIISLSIYISIKKRSEFNLLFQNRFKKLFPGIQIIVNFIIKNPLNFLPLFFISPLGRIAAMLPITLNGLGIYEGSMVYLLRHIDIPPDHALAGILVGRIITWVFSSVVIVWLLWFRTGLSRQVVK